MKRKQSEGKIIVPAKANPWPHEMKVAKILSEAGYIVEFIPKTTVSTADILLNGIEFEIKSPKTSNANSLEHILKKALKQSPNIILDTSRVKNLNENNMRNFLVTQVRSRKQIKKLLMITKRGRIIDIFTLI